MLVVDGGGSMRCALLGDNIAEMAYKNGWSVRTAPLLLLSLRGHCFAALVGRLDTVLWHTMLNFCLPPNISTACCCCRFHGVVLSVIVTGVGSGVS